MLAIPVILLLVKLFTSVGVSIWVLYYCLLVTCDYRKRRRFSEATQDLTLEELEAGFGVNIRIVAEFLQDQHDERDAHRKAEAALVMATVLREHIAAKKQEFPLPRYLKSRRKLWRQAKSLKL